MFFFPERIPSVCALCTQGPLLQPTSASLVLLGLAKASVKQKPVWVSKTDFLEEGRGVWGVAVAAQAFMHMQNPCLLASRRWLHLFFLSWQEQVFIKISLGLQN